MLQVNTDLVDVGNLEFRFKGREQSWTNQNWQPYRQCVFNPAVDYQFRVKPKTETRYYRNVRYGQVYEAHAPFVIEEYEADVKRGVYERVTVSPYNE